MSSDKSLYAQYIKERKGVEIIENKFGFISYKIINEECFIEDLFIVAEERKGGKFKDLFDELQIVAKEAKCQYVSGLIWVNDPNCKDTLAISLQVGFIPQAAANGAIQIVFRLEGV
jgi:hypothetical protein